MQWEECHSLLLFSPYPHWAAVRSAKDHGTFSLFCILQRGRGSIGLNQRPSTQCVCVCVLMSEIEATSRPVVERQPIDKSSTTHTLTSLLLWYIAVGVLNRVVCQRWEPFSGNGYKIGEPGVEKLLLPGCSGDDDVKGRVRGRVGGYWDNVPIGETDGDRQLPWATDWPTIIGLEWKLKPFAPQRRSDLLDFLHCCFGVNKAQSAYWEGDVALLHGQLMIERPKEAVQSKFGGGVRRHKRTGHFTCKPVSIGKTFQLWFTLLRRSGTCFGIQLFSQTKSETLASFDLEGPCVSWAYQGSWGNSLTGHMLLLMLWKNSQYAKRKQPAIEVSHRRESYAITFWHKKQDKIDQNVIQKVAHKCSTSLPKFTGLTKTFISQNWHLIFLLSHHISIQALLTKREYFPASRKMAKGFFFFF